jgi:hypothetical protein
VCGDPGLRRDDGRGSGEVRDWSPFTIQPDH